MIKSMDELEEGEVINDIIYERMIRGNKNFLAAVVGPTGSGKSYACLRICELWYKKKFKKKFSIINICWTPEDVMERLTSGKLERGELFVLEEGGTSMGNLDFQNKMSKIFNYVLQSFRSMNVGLIINLPFFTMLNKTTRMLMHMKFKVIEIDHKTNQVILSPHEIKYSERHTEPFIPHPKVLVNGSMEKVYRVGYSLPSKELIEEYESAKSKFVKTLSEDVLREMKKKRKKDKGEDTGLDKHKYPLQYKIYHKYFSNGITKQQEIAKLEGTSIPNICKTIIELRKKGYFPKDFEEN